MIRFSDQTPSFEGNPFEGDGIRASIDIGTNTVLLLVAEVKDGKLTVLHQDQRIPRLGKGVDSSKNLSSDSMMRVIEVLIAYRNFIYDHYGVIPVVVTATSAVRDASNRIEFMWLVEEATGYRLRLLSAAEEAETTFRGALFRIQEDSRKPYLVFDIGGGSTEVAIGSKKEGIRYARSFDIGSVRFSERYFGQLPPSKDVLIETRKAIREAFQKDMWSVDEATEAIGVAGTAISVACLAEGLSDFKPELVENMQVSSESVDNMVLKLSELNVEEILNLSPALMEGRADIILAGTLILQEILLMSGFSHYRVSSGGIRHGMVTS